MSWLRKRRSPPCRPLQPGNTNKSQALPDSKDIKEFGTMVIIAAQFFVGVVAGGYAGQLTKKYSKEALYHIGAGVVALELLQYKGWIRIHWRRVGGDVGKALDANNDGKVDAQDVALMFKAVGSFFKELAPLGAGLSIGFWSQV